MDPACSADLKTKGNAAFQAQDYETAAEWFTKGIAVDGANHVLFSNRSAALAGLKQYGEALADADKCISLKPDWGKGYARRGYARAGLGDIAGALQAYRQGLTVEPGLSILQEGVERHLVAEMREKLVAAGDNMVLDSVELLKWEGRIEELLEGQPDAICCTVISKFVLLAHVKEAMGMASEGVPTRSKDHYLSAVRLQERQVELLGKMERFRDQGRILCHMANNLNVAGKTREAIKSFQRARDVGAAHGFFSVECQACLGLGQQTLIEGRHEEGVALLQNALAAAPLSEEVDSNPLEINVLRALANALCTTNANIDEVEPVVLRFREVLEAQPRSLELPCFLDLHIFYCSARVHEARGKPHEAERDVRMMLDFLRDNRAAMQVYKPGIEQILGDARTHLTTLDPALGNKELIKSVEVEAARLRGE